VKITGCTVHYVTADVDGGPIIEQMPVRIESNDTLETLTTKNPRSRARAAAGGDRALSETAFEVGARLSGDPGRRQS